MYAYTLPEKSSEMHEAILKNEEETINKFEIGENTKVKITKVNFNDNNLVVIGKIINEN